MRAGMGEAWHGDSITLLTVQEALTKKTEKENLRSVSQKEGPFNREMGQRRGQHTNIVLKYDNENKCESQYCVDGSLFSFRLEKFTRICLQNPTHSQTKLHT